MNKKLKLLIALQIIVTIVLFYGYFLQSYLTSATKLDVAFTQAKTYVYVSEMIVQSIEDKLPEEIKDNFIKNAIVMKITNSIVTPENVRTVVQKPVQKVVKTIVEKGELKGDKVVTSTVSRKQQAQEQVNAWDLPPKITTTITSAVNSIPDEITVVDLEKNPDSVIGKLVKTKTYLGWLESFVQIMAVVMVGLVGLTIYYCWKKWRLMVKVFSWVFVITGVVITMIVYLVPEFINNIYYVPNPLTVDQLFTNLTIGLANYYIALPRDYGLALIIIGAVMMVLNHDRVYNWLSGLIKNSKAKIKSRKNKSSGKKRK